MLEPMPDALKTDATKVRGCSASVWVYPTRLPTAGCISSPTAMPRSPRASSRWSCRRCRTGRPEEVARLDIAAELAPFDLQAPIELQPHAGRSQHDRAGPRDRASGWRHEQAGDARSRRRRHAPASTPSASSSWPARSATAARSASNFAAPATTGPSWPCRGASELVGVPESGILASGAIVSLIDTASGTSVWIEARPFPADRDARPAARLSAAGARRARRSIARCECYKLTRSIALRPRHCPWRRPGAADRPQRRDLHAQPLRRLLLPLFGAAQHVIGRLDLLEALRGFLVALLQVRMILLGQPAIGGLADRLKSASLSSSSTSSARISSRLRRAVAGPAPLPVRGLAEGRGAGALLGLARRFSPASSPAK